MEHRPGSLNPKVTRLAIVVSHPIQYYAPWFTHLASQPGLELKVFYLWDFGVEARFDQGFGQILKWDIPLLEGYEHVFVPNRSMDPGTHHFRGLDNHGLVPALEAWKPDAILLFGYAFLSHLRVMLSRRLKGIPILLRGDSHDLARPRGVKQALKRRLRGALFKRFAGFLSVGTANTDYLRHSGVPAGHIFFAPHCVDNAGFQAAAPKAAQDAAAWRSELGIPRDALVLLFAGKFEDKKRPMDLLEAFNQASAIRVGSAPESILLFVGAGAWEARLRSAAGPELGSRIFFAPFQNQTRMPMVYATGDVLVLPSFGADETWGLAVNEAMNLARPVIVSSHVGCGPDLVLPRETGWIFEAGRVGALATALGEAMAVGRDGLADMGLAARARVAGHSYEAATTGLWATLDFVVHRVQGGIGNREGIR